MCLVYKQSWGHVFLVLVDNSKYAYNDSADIGINYPYGKKS